MYLENGMNLIWFCWICTPARQSLAETVTMIQVQNANFNLRLFTSTLSWSNMAVFSIDLHMHSEKLILK